MSGCIGRTVFVNTLPNDPLAYDPVTLEPLKPRGLLTRITRLVFNKHEPLEGQKQDRINILLLGMGGLGHDGPFLTDTIVLTSMQPTTGEVAMVSIPRDLGVDIPGKGWYKINHANAFGESRQSGSGGSLATRVVADTFNVNIPYYIRVDFSAVEKIIDDIDGVTIDVERAFTDTQYPASNYEYQTISFQNGVQTMDGATALTYIRSRHGNNGEGSDFARARRQQRMILALKEKILSFETLANPIRIHSIMETLGAHLTTNMDFADIISMMKIAKQADFSNILPVVLDSSPDGYLKETIGVDGAYMLAPVTGNFENISALIENIFDTDSSLVPKTPIDTPEQEKPVLTPAIVEIDNGTWRAGLAAQIKKQLEDDGIVVTTIGNTTQRPVLQSAIYVLNARGQETANAIKSALSIPIKETPNGVSWAIGTEVLVILGEDF